MKKLTIAMVAALGLATAPVMAQGNTTPAPTAGAGGVNGLVKAIGELGPGVLAAGAVTVIAAVSVIAKSPVDPMDKDDDDRPPTTTTTVTPPPPTTTTTTTTTTTNGG
ncbi:hypothetical protein CWE15_11455 [Aliidiomarina taiwanensis]|uniref:Uncharacterized protein n=1 Tax=Aliidiomarina taiwanensis TaxID=946228 RepID=A0A432WTM9_9GAMM|nr:hypothetical protein [Aliidiomarina taiwanensis]RUO37119.1 hypothetical protein CWE15_11455 [Aliidiomarina taiwanensis]